MNNTEIQKLNIEELKASVATSAERLQKMKFAHAMTPLPNGQELSKLRKHIARLNTELRAKQLTDAAK